MLKIYNTLTRKKEDFKSIKKEEVDLYTCGPTVYNYAHIGNLRTYVFEDILKRVLKYNNYTVKHVMNITDVGHLTSDADEGEDKMAKGAKREKKTPKQIAEFYEEAFMDDMKSLNLELPNLTPRATEHVQEMIDQIKKLEENGYTYVGGNGNVYFDTKKFKNYGELAQLDKQELQAGARIEVDTNKKNPSDFVLWFVSSKHGDQDMQWDSPWGRGFPSWHLECSAMACKYLGEQFDIHCGGIDHIPVHHTNEIAQAEGATGKKPWVNYWLHGEFLVLGKDNKMSKSSENFITLKTLKEKNINTIAYRYFLLQTHYRKQLNFSWEAIKAAQTGLHNIWNKLQDLKEKTKDNKNKNIDPYFLNKFIEFINDDLNTAGALALIPEILKSNLDDKIKLNTILKFDEIFGLNFDKNHYIVNLMKTIDMKENLEIKSEIKKLMIKRKKAREEKNWAESDKIRDEIKKLGYEVKDEKDGEQTIAKN